MAATQHDDWTPPVDGAPAVDGAPSRTPCSRGASPSYAPTAWVGNSARTMARAARRACSSARSACGACSPARTRIPTCASSPRTSRALLESRLAPSPRDREMPIVATTLPWMATLRGSRCRFIRPSAVNRPVRKLIDFCELLDPLVPRLVLSYLERRPRPAATAARRRARAPVIARPPTGALRDHCKSRRARVTANPGAGSARQPLVHSFGYKRRRVGGSQGTAGGGAAAEEVKAADPAGGLC